MISKGEGKFEQKHKTEVTAKVADEHDLKVTMTQKDWTTKWNYAPAQFCTDGKEVTFEGEMKRAPVAGTMEGKLENKCGGYDMGPVKGWSELQFDFKKDKDAPMSTEMTFSQSLKWTDFFLACRFVTPVPQPALSSAAATLFWSQGAWDLWARGSFIRKAFGAGLTWRHTEQFSHSTEVLYDMNPDGKNKGLFNTPLFWRYGLSLKS